LGRSIFYNANKRGFLTQESETCNLAVHGRKSTQIPVRYWGSVNSRPKGQVPQNPTAGYRPQNTEFLCASGKSVTAGSERPWERKAAGDLSPA